MRLLSDFRVVELAQGIAGPFCAKLLADLGAEVVKAEPPEGDAARRFGPFPGDVPHAEKSGLFLYNNTGKLGVTLNVDDPDGRQLFLRLLQHAEVLITDMPPSLARRRKLSYQTLTRRFPQLIVTSLTPFGAYGPHAEFQATDFIIAHASGSTYPNAQMGDDAEQKPSLNIPGCVASFYGGFNGAVAVLAAVFSRKQNGRGQHVDISLQEAVTTNLRHDIAAYTFAKQVPVRRVGYVAPTTINTQQPTADGNIAFLMRPAMHWKPLMGILGDPDWSREPLFQDPRTLCDHWEAISPLLGESTKRMHTKALYLRCQELGIPAAPVNTIADAVATDQYLHRRYFVEAAHPIVGWLRYPGHPVRFAEPQAVLQPAPTLGQHNREIFVERLGLQPADLARLRSGGVL